MRNNAVYILFAIISIGLLFQTCQSEQEITYARYYVSGKGLYEKHCQNCHAADGSGLKNLYPALTDTSFIKKNKSELACIIKYGMDEMMTINGQDYEGKMPPNTQLADIEVTQILVYISNTFGNNLGAFNLKQVTAELKECR